MTLVWLAALIVAVPFGAVLLFGAPYLPTRKREVSQALDMLNLSKGEVLVDLGSGDGSLLLAAAKRGLYCYGYELNPLLWVISYMRTRRYSGRVKVYCRNFWTTPLPVGTKGVFVFLLDKYMRQLDDKLTKELIAGGRLVSYTFKVPKKKPLSQESAMYLYEY